MFLLALSACFQARPTEFKVQLYCRGDAEECIAPWCVQEDPAAALAENAAEGWQYVGPLSDNGMNCTYVAFGR